MLILLCLHYAFLGPLRRPSITSMVRMLYPLPLLSISRQELDNFCLSRQACHLKKKTCKTESTKINSFGVMQEIISVCLANVA